MLAPNRNLIALAVGVLVSPLALSQDAAVDSATAKATPATYTTPQTNTAPPKTEDAVSNKTTEREGAMGSSTQAATTQTASTSSKGDWWKDADTDNDGKLSASEATANAGLSSRFSTIDADKDGFVTMDEYRAYYANNASPGEHAAAHAAVINRELWVKLDTDADSRISLAEAAANSDLNASFSAMDSNSDGFLTQAEYTTYTNSNK